MCVCVCACIYIYRDCVPWGDKQAVSDQTANPSLLLSRERREQTPILTLVLFIRVEWAQIFIVLPYTGIRNLPTLPIPPFSSPPLSLSLSFSLEYLCAFMKNIIHSLSQIDQPQTETFVTRCSFPFCSLNSHYRNVLIARKRHSLQGKRR